MTPIQNYLERRRRMRIRWENLGKITVCVAVICLATWFTFRKRK